MFINIGQVLLTVLYNLKPAFIRFQEPCKFYKLAAYETKDGH